MDLPEAYLAYMQSGRPVEGELSVDPGWFQLWPVDELDELNQGYRAAEWLPKFRGFGSNGGGEMLAFDPEDRIVTIPFIPMDEKEPRLVAESWIEFETKMLNGHH
ncbi:MAG: SMI1/KNR4 family protein [Thermoguttaceae bacterium]